MTHHAKAPSAGSTQATGDSRGLYRRAFATRGAFRGSNGSGAPSSRRMRNTLAVLALAIAAFAATAAPASAALPSAEMEAITEVSYASAHVTGKVTGDGSVFGVTSYKFQYSTDESTWSTGYSEDIFAGGPVTDKEVGATISVPKGGTKYFVRLVVNNGFANNGEPEVADPEAAPYPSFTTLAVDPPAIPGAVGASPIFSTSATATGTVKRPANADPAFDVNCHFEYISDAQFLANEGNGDPGFQGASPVDCAQNPVSPDKVDGSGEAEVTAPLGCTNPLLEDSQGKCLKPETSYHLRLVAENAAPGVATKDGAATFTTVAKVAAPTVIATGEATDVSYKSAKASGEVQRPGGEDPALDTECRFEYITDTQFLANEGASEPGFSGAAVADCDINPVRSSDPTPTAVKAELNGLKSGVTYHYRLTANNAGGTDSKVGADTFTTTPGGEPTVTTDPISDIGYTSARVTGTVTSGVDPEVLSYAFQHAEVGTEDWSGYQNNRTFNGDGSPLAPGSGPQNVSIEFTDLRPDTDYKFRLSYGGNNGSYIPSPEPYPTATTRHLEAPTATLDPVTIFTGTTAHFSGTVDTHAPAGPLDDIAKAAYKTDWHFECTPACPDPGGKPYSGTVQGEEGSKAIVVDATHLDANTHYEVKLVAHNEFYSVETPVQTFDTPLIKPTIKAAPGGSDGKGGYTFQATVNPNGSNVSDCKFEWGPDSNYVFSVPCSPMPEGRSEVQSISLRAFAPNATAIPVTGGQFQLTYRGQTTSDLPYNATAAEVEAELEALPAIGPGSVGVTSAAQSYKVTFEGALAETDTAQIQGKQGTIPLDPPENSYGPSITVSTLTQGGNNSPVTVEAHLTGLNPGVVYHYNLLATNEAGTEESGDQEFTPTLADKDNCANEQIRTENSSLALPECRAYEVVTPPGKEGFPAMFQAYGDGDSVLYRSRAGNIAKSGQNSLTNDYVSLRAVTGWETIPNLNGSSGSVMDAPTYFNGLETRPHAYSADLRTSIWDSHKHGDPSGESYYLRNPDGTFTLIGLGYFPECEKGPITSFLRSDDLSHLVVDAAPLCGETNWGPGVYEYIGTGVDQPRRVDLDNFNSPTSSCIRQGQQGMVVGNAEHHSMSADGRVIVFTAFGGCGGPNPPANELWARVNGTTSYDVSTSQCNRTAADPGGTCNGPVEPGGCFPALRGEDFGHGCRDAHFAGAAKDGSRVYFTTTQQLINGDTDQTNDLYACDIPSGNPAPTAERANPCAAFRQISGTQTGAEVENVLAISEGGSTVLFTAKGVLASNENALKEQAFAGDHNLYVWRIDAAHPAGQTSFVGRLDDAKDPGGMNAQSTPDGRYLVFHSTSRLVDTDTDDARDVYRYDAEDGQLNRASTNAYGVAGNGGFDASGVGSAISDDGQKIVFVTTEGLSPADGNAEFDVYLWTPARVSLISTGSSGYPIKAGNGDVQTPRAAITGSGQDIYFESAQPLTPADGDDTADIYDARTGGGFSFTQAAPCSGAGGTCQFHSSGSAPAPAPVTAQPPTDPGNVRPKTCPKGKVLKGNKCVKKKHKKNSGRKHHGKKAAHKRGGGK